MTPTHLTPLPPSQARISIEPLVQFMQMHDNALKDLTNNVVRLGDDLASYQHYTDATALKTLNDNCAFFNMRITQLQTNINQVLDTLGRLSARIDSLDRQMPTRSDVVEMRSKD